MTLETRLLETENKTIERSRKRKHKRNRTRTASWQNVLSAFADVVSGRIVRADDVITNGSTTVLDTASEFGG